jgi:hypothetical protein
MRISELLDELEEKCKGLEDAFFDADRVGNNYEMCEDACSDLEDATKLGLDDVKEVRSLIDQIKDC